MTRKQSRLLVKIFFIITMMTTVASTVFARQGEIETANVFVFICVGSAFAGLLVQFLQWIAPNLGSKPTREEFERRIKG